MIGMTRRLALAAAAAALTTTAALAQAQPAAPKYPLRPITFVVPFAPGGIADPVGRIVGQKMSESLGQPVVIDNKPGAAGFVGAQVAKQAAPDGYTLFMGNMGTHAVNPALFTKMPYDPADFIPITALVATPHVLVVHRDSPIRSVADLIARAKAAPGTLSFASQGIGTGGQLLAEMLQARTGISAVHVPYKGAAPALQDVLANRVDFFFDSLSTSLPHIRGGKLRVLATAAPKRLAQLPDTPTMAELGQPGIELSFWFGMFALAGTPEAIVDKLHAELVKAIQLPESREKIQPIGLQIVANSRADFAAQIAADRQRLGKVILDANIVAD